MAFFDFAIQPAAPTDMNICNSTSTTPTQPNTPDRKHARDTPSAVPQDTPDSGTMLEIDTVRSSPGCERPRILFVLSSLLEEIVAHNERIQQEENAMRLASGCEASPSMGKVTVFHGLRAPSITIDKYLERIFKYANCSPACFVLAYVYLERAMTRRSGLPITSLNVHRLLVTAVMLAAKFLDDAYFNNAYYAKVGGVTTAEMNRLELEFLFRLDFRLSVTVSEFELYCRQLEKGKVDVRSGKIERPITAVRETGFTHHSSCGQKKRLAVGCPASMMVSYSMHKKAQEA